MQDPIEPARRLPPSRRLSRREVSGLLAIALLFAAGAAFWVWSAPYRAVDRFIAAVERQDAADIYRLSSAEERQSTHLTPQAISLALTECFGGPVVQDGYHPDTRWYRRESGMQYERSVFWARPRTRTRLPGRWGTRRPQLRSLIIASRAKEGWRINVGAWINSTYRSKWGAKDYRPRYEAFARRAALTAYVNEAGRRVETALR